MRPTRTIFYTFILYLWLCLSVSVAYAARIVAPHTVTLFPQSAQLAVTQHLAPSEALTFYLPEQAAPDTFSLTVPGYTVADIRWERITGTIGASEEELKQKFELALQAARQAAARKASLETRIALWQTTRSSMNSTAELELLDAAMQQRLTDLYVELAQAEEASSMLEKKLKKWKKKLKKQLWSVTAYLTSSPIKPITAHYTYLTSNCGWNPVYTLHAMPEKNSVEFRYTASLWQNMGFPWKNVQLAIATLPPNIGLAPPVLPEWNIRKERTYPSPLLKNSSMDIAEIDQAEELAAKAPRTSHQKMPPKRELATTYARWDLGTMSLPSGGELRAAVLNETWAAEFLYTTRPARSPAAFLTANVTLPTARVLPSGMATLIVDNATTGSRRFTLAGKEETLHFGNDPLVSATMNLQKQQASSGGYIFNKKQVLNWAWNIVISNARTKPVRVEVQDAAPRLRVGGELVLQSTPKPHLDEKSYQYLWNIEVPAASEEQIIHRVTATVPTMEPLDAGRLR